MSAHHISSVRLPRIDVRQRPFIVIWEMTRACDLVCKHCRAEAQPIRNPLELSTDEARNLIDEIASFGSPPVLFVMTGGDPMKRPDLAELVAHASGRNLPTAFSPSATPLLTRDVIVQLKAAGLKALSLSVDGSCPAIHDAFRGVSGVFERTMAAWETARELGIKVQINTTISRVNLFDLPRIAHLVRERGAMLWSGFMLVPVGRGVAVEPITADECEDVMNFLYDVGAAIPTKTTEGHHFRRVVLEREILAQYGIEPTNVLKLGPTYQKLRAALEPWPTDSGQRRSPMDINAARGFVFISHLGTVHPSGFLPVSAGNIRQQTLADIYRNSQVFKDLRDPKKLHGRCRDCEFAPRCGGSRSRAYATSGDALGEDPLCGYVPGSFPFQADVARLLGPTGEY